MTRRSDAAGDLPEDLQRARIRRIRRTCHCNVACSVDALAVCGSASAKTCGSANECWVAYAKRGFGSREGIRRRSVTLAVSYGRRSTASGPRLPRVVLRRSSEPLTTAEWAGDGVRRDVKELRRAEGVWALPTRPRLQRTVNRAGSVSKRRRAAAVSAGGCRPAGRPSGEGDFLDQTHFSTAATPLRTQGPERLA